MKAKLRAFLTLLMALILTGCTAAPVALVSPTLPPISPGPDAPIGDAGLRYEAIVPLSLPARDGQTLLTFYETMTLSHDQHPAETILRALLSHPGSSRVQPLGQAGTLTLSGTDPVEISGSICTVNLSAGAYQLSSEALYTAGLAIAATLCELPDIDHVNLLIAGVPVALDVSGSLPLGTLSAHPGQELPVLWEQMSSRRTPVGELPSSTPLTATATLYFPLADGSGILAEPRRISFPGQHPQQQVIALLEALSAGAESLAGTAEVPDMNALQLFVPEVTELQSGGRRVTLHLRSDAVQRITDLGSDPTCVFAAITATLTTFVPSLQQVCVLTGDGALTSLYSSRLGSLLFPGGLMTRQDFVHTLVGQSTVYVPGTDALIRRQISLPYRHAASPRTLLLTMASPEVDALPAGLNDADLLGIAVAGDTVLVHFSARYGDVLRDSPCNQRLTAYAMVNTLCEALHLRRVRFYFGGEALADLGSDLSWSGEFLYRPSFN